MTEDEPKGSDLTLGVAPDELAEDATLLGHVGVKDDAIVLVIVL
jgi:hypothetical protein